MIIGSEYQQIYSNKNSIHNEEVLCSCIIYSYIMGKAGRPTMWKIIRDKTLKPPHILCGAVAFANAPWGLIGINLKMGGLCS